MITHDCPQELNTRIHNAITTNAHLSRRNLRFETEQGKVVLRGVVSSFYQKQMAQEALRRVDGIDAIENLLEVSWA